MAIILNQKMTGRTFFRAVFFLPVILSTGIIDAIDTRIAAGQIVDGSSMDEGTGEASGGLMSSLDIEMLLSSVNLKIGQFDFAEMVTTLVNNIFDIVSRSGVQMLIFLSGLQSISPSIYESCQVEGATAWETFWKITLPMISPMILVNAIYTVVDLFTAADNRVMQGLGGYGGMFGDKNPGNFSAGIWVYTALVLVVIVVVALLLRTVVFYQRRD
jgi:ABC-type sugar transport system permease subunit